MSTEPVKLYIYELSNGLARQMSPLLLGKQIDGIWHTGVVCFGREYFFGGGGIEYCLPGGTILGQPDEIISLGNTHVPEEVFMEFLQGLGADSFRADKYHLFEHNCNKFSNEVTLFLTGRKIPKHIYDLPNDILNSAFGQMIKPIVDSMRVTPAGGSTVSCPGQGTSSYNSHPRHDPTMPRAEETKNPESIFEPRSTTTLLSNKQEHFPPPVIYKVDNAAQLVEALKGGLGEASKEFEPCLVDIERIISKKNEVRVSDEIIICLEKLFLKSKEIKNESGFLLTVLGLMKGFCLEKSFLEHPGAHDVLSKLVGELAVFPSKQNQIVLLAALQVLCNAVSTKDGHDLLLSNKTPRTDVSSVITNCLLEGTQDVQLAASELTFNMARYQVSEDIAFECSTPVMELLAREPDRTMTYYCLFSLHRFMQCNSEVSGLAKALDIDVTKYKGQSDNVDSVCQHLESLMS